MGDWVVSNHGEIPSRVCRVCRVVSHRGAVPPSQLCQGAQHHGAACDSATRRTAAVAHTARPNTTIAFWSTYSGIPSATATTSGSGGDCCAVLLAIVQPSGCLLRIIRDNKLRRWVWLVSIMSSHLGITKCMSVNLSGRLEWRIWEVDSISDSWIMLQ